MVLYISPASISSDLEAWQSKRYCFDCQMIYRGEIQNLVKRRLHPSLSLSRSHLPEETSTGAKQHRESGQKDMAKARVLVLMVAAALLIFPCTASADDQPVCRFTGTATLDSANVPDGTVITAIIGNDEYTTTTPTGYGPSTYSIAIQPPGGTHYPDGTAVSFKIDGFAAHQTGILHNGENIRRDLTASTGSTSIPTPPSGSATSSNAWLIVGLVAASIVEVLLVVGVARIVISNWNR